MFWLQIWRRIHKPFVFLAFGFLILFATTSKSQSTIDLDHNEHLRAGKSSIPLPPNDSPDDLLARSLKPPTDREHVTNDSKMKIQLLPFCQQQKRGDGSSANDGDGGLGTEHNSSDEIVLSSKFGGGKQIVIATLDGQLSFLDQSGRILWSFCTGLLFSSTISSLQLRENGKMIHLIPSLTGGLYKYDGDDLKPVPLNADYLLKKSFKLANDVVITGGKELKTFGLELNTGDVRYECGISGCESGKSTDSSSTVKHEKDDVLLVVKKQMQTVRAIDSLTGEERWNFSVGTHELALAGVTEGCYESEEKETNDDKNNFLRMSIPDGIVYGGDEENKRIWQYQFESPISQAWILDKGRLIAIDPIKSSPMGANSPALYIGINKNNQLYVQESHTTMDRIEKALLGSLPTPLSPLDPLQIGWKPAIDSDLSNDQKALAHFSDIYSMSPNFKGAFVYEKDELAFPAIEAPPLANNSEVLEDEEEKNEQDWDFEETESFGDNDSDIDNTFDEDNGAIQIIFVSLWFWWKEVLGISLLTAVLLNILLMRPMMRAVRSDTIREMFAYFRNFRNAEEYRGVRERRESEKGLLPLPATHNPRTRSVSSSSVNSQVEELPFTSQYLNEFEPIQCLGKGGFGVVIEAKKKIDERHYAVKRICLPNKKKSRDRVMREVKALAKLEHKNIVRYFNAWIETPPAFWLEKNDPLWNSKNIDSPSATYNNYYGSPSTNYNMSVSLDDHNSIRKRDHLQISGFPDKTPIEEQPPDDSFIVFGEEGDSFNFNKTDGGMGQSVSKFYRENSASDSDISRSNSRRGFFVRPTTLDIPSIEQSIEASINEEDKEEEVGKRQRKDSSPADIVTYLYIQQELCQKKTLKDWLREYMTRDVRIILKFFQNITEAVEYIHSNKLIHRDLKPSNIFLAGSDEDVVTLKIGDFGLATTDLKEIEIEKQEKGLMTPMDGTRGSNLTGQVGTYLYLSPEMSKRRPYDSRVDIYSLGLIFFELLVPFSTEMERYDVLARVRKLSFPKEFKETYCEEYSLIQDMVSHDPNSRPTATDVKLWVKSRLNKQMLPHSISCPDEGGGDKQPLLPLRFNSDNSLNHDAATNIPQNFKVKSRLKHLKSQSFR